MKRIIFIILLISNGSFAKEISCIESKNFIEIAQKTHIVNTNLDDNFSKKALVNYINGIDANNFFLLESEYSNIINNYPYTVVSTLLNGPSKSFMCENIFKDVDLKIVKGIKRYNKIIKNFKINEKENVKKEENNDIQLGSRFKDEKSLKKHIENVLNQQISRSLLKNKDLNTQEFINEALTSEDIFEETSKPYFITRMFILSFDPHSNYYNDKSSTDFLNELNSRMVGIGIEYKLNSSGIEIISLLSGGPFEKSGKIKSGDIIVEMDGIPLKHIKMKEVSDILLKPIGYKASFKIRRNNNVPDFLKELTDLSKKFELDPKLEDEILYSYEDVQIEYESIEITTTKIQSRLIEKENIKILYIKVPQFYSDNIKKSGTTLDTLAEYFKYKDKKIDIIMMDLRSNPGGYLDEAISLAGLFLGDRTVIMTKERINNELVTTSLSPTNVKGNMPIIKEKLVVLSDKLSASSSEIFIGAIKDYERGIVIGDNKTFGKGTIQDIDLQFISLKLGVLTITKGFFFQPSGHSNQIEGISPNIIIKTQLSKKKIGEKYTNFPIPIKKIDPATDYSADRLFFGSGVKSFSQKYSNNEDKEHDQEEFLKKSIEIAIEYSRETNDK